MCSEPHIIILFFINTILNDVLLVECADTDYDNKFGSNSTHVGSYLSLADRAISSCIIYMTL